MKSTTRKISGARRSATLLIATLTGVALAVLTPTVSAAHAVVFPKTSAPSAYEKYVLRVQNEKNVPTTRVEIRFPGGC